MSLVSCALGFGSGVGVRERVLLYTAITVLRCRASGPKMSQLTARRKKRVLEILAARANLGSPFFFGRNPGSVPPTVYSADSSGVVRRVLVPKIYHY